MSDALDTIECDAPILAAASTESQAIPPGYQPVPRDALLSVNGGLRITPDILANEAGCWHVRWRNPHRRAGGPSYVWMGEVDPRAAHRYQYRAFVSAAGTQVPAGCLLKTSCGDPQCISPYHLSVYTPPPVPLAPRAGHYAWVGEGADEQRVWIPDPQPAEPTAQPKVRPEPRIKPAPKVRPESKVSPGPKAKAEPKGRARGERSGQSKLDEEAVRTIRANADKVSKKALARQYGVDPATIRKIIERRSWAHVP